MASATSASRRGSNTQVSRSRPASSGSAYTSSSPSSSSSDRPPLRLVSSRSAKAGAAESTHGQSSRYASKASSSQAAELGRAKALAVPARSQDASGAAEAVARRERPYSFFVGLLVAICIVLAAIVIIYPVAQDYYVTMRENQRLQAEYDAVQARNDKIQSEIDYLNTNEGIEDSARSQLGYVMPGENAVSVPDTGKIDSTTTLPDEVDSASIKAPETWWTKILDVVFQVA